MASRAARRPLAVNLLAAWSMGLGALVLTSAPPSAYADDWELERAPGRAKARLKNAAVDAGSARRPAQPGKHAKTASDAQDTQRTRYLELVLRQPNDDGAFERLTALYRARDGNLDGLQGEITSRMQVVPAQSPAREDPRGQSPAREDPRAQLALLLVQGRIHQALGQLDEARASFIAAGDKAPKDPLAHMLRALKVACTQLQPRA